MKDSDGTAELTTVTIESPIVRGNGSQEIREFTLRRPKAGELRGLSLAKLCQMDVDEIRKLLPRITNPTLTLVDVDQLDTADLVEVADKVTDFLLSKQRRAELPTT